MPKGTMVLNFLHKLEIKTTVATEGLLPLGGRCPWFESKSPDITGDSSAGRARKISLLISSVELKLKIIKHG